MRRKLASIAAALLGAALLSGPAAADSPVLGGTITQAVDIEPATLDPIFGNAPGKDRAHFTLLFENLFVQDEKGNLVPQLAKSWEIAPDEKSITFKLREGVVFHDGTPFDAAAVKYNFDRVIDPKVKARGRQYLTELASTEIIDPMTVKVNFTTPSGAVISGLANDAGMLSSPTAVQKSGEDYGRNPVGTGPFRFVSWTGGDRITLAKFPKYWNKDEAGRQLPYLDGVVTRFIPNTTVKIVEVRSGNVQVGDLVQVKDYAQVEKDPATELVPNHVGTAQYMSFNLTRPPFDNIEFRKAVAKAIDRDVIAKVVAKGEGLVTPFFEPPASWAYSDKVVGHKVNLAEAQKHLQASGFTGGISLAIIQRDPDTQIAQIIQSQLKQLGIDVKIESFERQAWLDRVLKYDYDFALQRANTPRADPDVSFSVYYSRKAPSNYAGIKDAKIFDNVDAAKSTTDQAERARLYHEIEQAILDNYYQTFLFWRANKDIKRAEVMGMRREFSGNWLFDRAWIAPKQ
jgi:peptide/nickel transport system substrate-binding protein